MCYDKTIMIGNPHKTRCQQLPPSWRHDHRNTIWRHTLYGNLENSLTALEISEKINFTYREINYRNSLL